MTRSPNDQLEDDSIPEEFPDEPIDEVAIDSMEPDGEVAVEGGGAVLESVDELKKVLAAELSTDTTQHYLNQIGTRPLLTAQQEVHFATLAKQGDF
jgi:RNA polymerase nonessential primary-like sigma factor